MEAKQRFENNWEEMAFEYPLYYEGKMVTCRVEPGESGYGILFDGHLIAELSINDSMEWEVIAGELDDDTVFSIGKTINDRFE